MSTPYEAPLPGVAPPAAPPAYTLFDSTAVGLATFFGTPIAGTILMAINYRRLGKAGQAAAAVLIGIVVTGLAVLLGHFMPQAAAFGIAAALFVGMKGAAQSIQGAAVAEHLREGGSLASNWTAFGLSVAACVLFFAAIFGVVYARAMLARGSRVVIGTKDSVYYASPVSQADATALGQALKTRGYFTDAGFDVILSRDQDGPAVSFIVKSGTWNQPQVISAFEIIGIDIAPSIGGFPFRIRLVNDARETQRELTIGESTIGTKDEIYYLGTATENDAASLGRALRDAGFFMDKGFLVLLSKEDATAVSFVVDDGTWNNAATVNDFEVLLRGTASSVGGLPVTLRLLSSPSLDTHLEVPIN